ncbi:uncharacterized protein [Miscanthus floridulus]|uniref:uncharacterized protein isoform X2 n=1 Tax=Miscanthus floridulus TaxID=154761 RepID=UPI0034598407
MRKCLEYDESKFKIPAHLYSTLKKRAYPVQRASALCRVWGRVSVASLTLACAMRGDRDSNPGPSGHRRDQQVKAMEIKVVAMDKTRHSSFMSAFGGQMKTNIMKRFRVSGASLLLGPRNMPTLETQISFAHVGFVYCPMEMTGSQKSLFRYKFRYGATTSGSQILPVGKLRAHSRVYQIESRSCDTKISENCSS